MTTSLRRAPCALALLVALLASHAAAGPITSLIVFGDSLSDTGNVLARMTTVGLGDARPTLPWYDTGRWSNGTTNDGSNTNAPRTKETAFGGVWHERLADKLKIPRATNSLAGGANWAYGGAVTAAGTFTFPFNFQNVRGQINAFLAANPAFNDKQLFAVWGGGNDVRDAANAANATPDTIKAAATAALDNLKAGIQALATAGAKNFIWPNLPPLQFTPEAMNLSDQGKLIGLKEASELFRDDQKDIVAGLMQEHAGISICVLDVHKTFEDILLNPGKFGLDETNRGVVTANSFTGQPFVVTANFPDEQVDADKFLFWDQVHPTAKTHDLLGMEAFTKLQAMIPEPSTAILMAPPIILFAFRRRAA